MAKTRNPGWEFQKINGRVDGDKRWTEKHEKYPQKQ